MEKQPFFIMSGVCGLWKMAMTMRVLLLEKAVVTSITPGMEIRNLYRPVTFVDRLRSLTILKK